MPTKTHTFSRGFTLVELLIVIAVIGILAGVVYTVTTSGMKNSSKTSLQTTASAVSSQLKAAAETLSYYFTENFLHRKDLAGDFT